MTRVPALAYTMDSIELSDRGGTRAVIDGKRFALFSGTETETIKSAANLNDGAYLPQVLNVNISDDPAHTIVSDQVTITMPAQNPGQITKSPLTPKSIGRTEISGQQTIVTLTNDARVQTRVRFESDQRVRVMAFLRLRSRTRH